MLEKLDKHPNVPSQNSRFVVIPHIEDINKADNEKSTTSSDAFTKPDIERIAEISVNLRNSRKAESLVEKLKNCNLVSFNSRIYSTTLRSQISVEEERKRHLDSFPSTIHPYSDLRHFTDIFITGLLGLYLIFQPIQIAYYSQSMMETSSAIISLIFSIFFFFDIFLNFKTGITHKEDTAPVLDSRIIAKNYLMTWFFLDLISSIPYDTIYVALNDIEGKGQLYFKYFRMLELLKIFRLTRVVRNLSRIQTVYHMKNANTRIVNLLVVLFFILHWLACWHFLIAHMFNSPPYPRNQLNWISGLDLWDHPVWEQYAHSVLRALSNMACLGYGYSAPRTPEDVLCSITSILVGATCFALFIANLSNILLNLDAAHKKYNQSLRQVKEYMKYKRMPKELQEKVGTYFEQKYRRNLFNEEEIMNVVSDVLREKLQMNNCQRLVSQVPLFNGLRPEILEEVVAQLKFEVYLPKDVIIHENTIGNSMYFIDHGTVGVFSTSGKLVNTLSDGQFFGEMALITNERRAASVIAMTSCDLYLLQRTDFHRVVKQYEEVYKSIVEVAMKRARERKISQETEKYVTSEATIKMQRPARKSIQEVDFVLTS